MSYLLFFLGVALSVIALLLCISSLKLALFGRAQVRKLREKHRELSERCEDILEKKLIFRVALQVETLLCATAAVATLTCWFIGCGVAPWLKWLTIALLLLAEIIAFLLTEQLVSLSGAAKIILAAAMPARLLYFLGIPFQMIEDRMDEKYPDDQENTVTAEDTIRSMVEEDETEESDPAAPEDDLEQDEKRMLTGVMNLDITLVHEIMTPRVDMDVISEDATVAQAKETIARSGHSRIPVFGKTIDAITGILYAKDLLDDAKTSEATAIRDFARPPVFIPETKNVADLLKEFRSKHNHMAIVIDEYGGTSGIVTIEDILEEIVGEIEDEFDRSSPVQENEVAPDGTITIDARASIWEINQTLDVEIPEDEGYDTLAGYIMTTLGRIPHTGEKVTTPALDAEIVCASPRRLITLKIRKKDGGDDK